MTGQDELQQLLTGAELERLRGILEDREDAVLSLVDAETRVIWASATGTSNVFRRADAAEYQGQQATQFVHPDDLPAYEASLRSARGGATARWEGQALAGSGRWVRVRTIMWRTQNGTDTVMVTVPLEVAT